MNSVTAAARTEGPNTTEGDGSFYDTLTMNSVTTLMMSNTAEGDGYGCVVDQFHLPPSVEVYGHC